jgi:hypothetical protein
LKPRQLYRESIILEAWEHLQPTIDHLVPLVADGELSVLSPTEQNIYLVWCYGAAICNGGHASFFYNYGGVYAHETVEALAEVGLPEFASLLGQAIDSFPNRIVPFEIEERNVVFNNLPPCAHDKMNLLDQDFFLMDDNYLMDSLFAYWLSLAR